MNECQVIETRISQGPRDASQSETALRVLLRAFDCARARDRDAWQFAVKLGELTSAGINSCELRKLVAQGFVAHALERAELRSGERTFQSVKNLVFGQDSCFVLMKKGELHVRQNLVVGRIHQAEQLEKNRHDDRQSSAAAAKPRWDVGQRILSLGGLVVKRFKRPAPHQELVIASFQELNWDRHIDDPIPPEKEMDPKERLHDTIKKLNRGQLNPLLRFYGDGTGRGVCWELRWSMT
jgi:hypothetical protein